MPLTHENSHEYWQNDNPVCPWCDRVYDIHDEEAWELYAERDSEQTITCPSCNKEYKVNIEVHHLFTTDDQETEDE